MGGWGCRGLVGVVGVVYVIGVVGLVRVMGVVVLVLGEKLRVNKQVKPGFTTTSRSQSIPRP